MRAATHFLTMVVVLATWFPLTKPATAQSLPDPAGHLQQQPPVVWDVHAYFLTRDSRTGCHQWQGPYPVMTFANQCQAEQTAHAMWAGHFCIPLLLPPDLKSQPMRVWPVVRWRYAMAY